METVLYADVLFLIDFSMDVVAVWLTACFMHARVTAGRVSAAALIGAAASTLLTVLSPGRVTVTLSGIAISFFMCKIVFNVRGSKALKYTSALWITGLLLGGVMSFLTAGNMSNSIRSPRVQTDGGGIRLLPVAVLLCAMLLFAVGKLSAKKTVAVELSLLEKEIKLTGLVDSGNLLRDPISGYPVVLITKRVAEMFMNGSDVEKMLEGNTEGLENSLRLRFRAVFAKSVTGEKMIPCLRPDTVKIGSRDCKAVIGISDVEEFADTVSCIVPSSLV